MARNAHMEIGIPLHISGRVRHWRRWLKHYRRILTRPCRLHGRHCDVPSRCIIATECWNLRLRGLANNGRTSRAQLFKRGRKAAQRCPCRGRSGTADLALFGASSTYITWDRGSSAWESWIRRTGGHDFVETLRCRIGYYPLQFSA